MSEPEDHTLVGEGWGVVHLMLRTRRGSSGDPIRAAIADFVADAPNQALVFSVMGGRADIGVMLLSPDLDALDIATKAIRSGPVRCVASFFSVTELSEYTTAEADERARLSAEGDPTIACFGDAMVIRPGHTRFGVMFGDNTGYMAACGYLADMLAPGIILAQAVGRVG